ncbi:PREDICTED: uncharacterized protein LOC104597991 [Nelumbo nucifera]|uniref:HTH OST-type domain-containing protein n=2 Tax=Nelumbo nucifera TaxID=4432 RepID=A0A822YKJ0_NELNU|nr:PREDICTED: uncharacterized protein LOC104597991 [Nelumbo nucifera]DAD31416.1 TPA_asm: hypothetical protein HUJ06_010267 [Nelumbo nucifera]
MMSTPITSAAVLSSESLDVNGVQTVNLSLQQSRTSSQGSIAILWDIENCPVPSDVRPEDVAGNIRMALRVHPVIEGAVTMFSAYGDFNAFPRWLREGCQRTGVKLIDVPNGRKDAADKAILVDMFLFALDNPPPSSIVLISGDVDFAPALHILGQRGYTIILVIPAGVGISSALSNAGRFVWDWPSVVRGEGFVPPKGLISHGQADISAYLVGCRIGENADDQIEEEAIVYKGISKSESSIRTNINQFYRFNSGDLTRTSQSLSEYNSNLISMPCFPTSRSHSLPSGLSNVSAGSVRGDQSEAHDPTSWVQPGDLNGLKGQLVKLLEMSGGSLPLVRIPAEYLKIYGRPLYVAEYGASGLVNLLKKMADVMNVERRGNRKYVYLRNHINRVGKTGSSTSSGLARRDKKGKGPQEENADTSVNVVPECSNSSDESSEDDKLGHEERSSKTVSVMMNQEINNHLQRFKLELQELLVSYSCRIFLGCFEEIYRQRYKKSLDYSSFGVYELEELIDKVKDIVVLHEEQGSKRKFLVAVGD